MSQRARPVSSLAIVSLVFGILAWLALPLMGGVVAVITGRLARWEIRREQSATAGDSMALAGLIPG